MKTKQQNQKSHLFRLRAHATLKNSKWVIDLSDRIKNCKNLEEKI